MQRLRRASNNSIVKILPTVFFGNGMISCILLFLSLDFFSNHESYRIILSTIFSVCIWAIVLFNILFNIKRYSKQEIFAVIIVIVLSALPLIVTIFKTAFDFSVLFAFGRYGLFSLPYIFVALILVKEKKYSEFLSSFKWYGVALLPFALFYVIRMFQPQTEINQYINIGGLSYMTIANTLAPIMVACLLDIVINNKSKFKYVNWVVAIVLWFAILYSGTRGTIVSILWFLLVLIVFYVRKNNRSINIVVFKQCIIVVLIFLFTSYCWAPISSAYGEEGRFKTTSLSNEFSRVENKTLDSIFLDEIVDGTCGAQQTVERLKEEIISGEKYQSYINNSTFTIKEVKDYEMNTGRVTLYKAALKEFGNNVLTGNGVMFFQLKYGVYPHNYVFESLCDLGIIVTVVLFGGIFLLLLSVIKCVRGNNEIKAIIVICLSFVPKYMLSGSLYLAGTLLFSITFGVLYMIDIYGCNNSNGFNYIDSHSDILG